MLASRVNVEIFGELAENLYSGYVSNDKIKNKKAYIISEKSVDGFYKGVVIAVATFDNGEERLIVASENEVFYEPDLRTILGKL